MSAPLALFAPAVAVLGLLAGGLTGCAGASGDEDAEANAAAVATAAPDAYDKAQALAPVLERAVIRAPIGVYFMPGQQTRLVGATPRAACYLTRVTGWRYERQLPAGSAFLIANVTVAHGRSWDGAPVDGAKGYLSERASDGTRGREASLELTCLAVAPGDMPTMDDIAATFAARGAMYVKLELPPEPPAP
jgi:hypothetical protein